WNEARAGDLRRPGGAAPTLMVLSGGRGGRAGLRFRRTDEHLVLRLLDRGDFVAQVTVTPWRKLAAGAHVSAAEFQNAMAEAPNWQQEKALEAQEVAAEDGRWVYRVSAEG